MDIDRRDLLRTAGAAGAGLFLGSLGLTACEGPGSDAAGAAAAGTGAGAPGQAPETGDLPASFEPFRIDYGEEALADLHRRIDATRWPEMPFETGWSAGTNDRVLRDLVDYWRNEYDWPAVQEQLNRLEHARGPIEGEALHFVRYPIGAGGGESPSGAEGNSDGESGADPGDVQDAAPFPILLLHGWPGSFHEFSAAAPRIASGAAGPRAFEVIVPSLPGFVFSEPPRAPGVNPGEIAERLHLLMLELGYDRYGVQGGDWGGIIGRQMALRHPEAMVGLHINFASSAPPPPEGESPGPEEQAYREYRARFSDEETGYSRIQGTRPQTLAYAQQDSPVGWLAWILEKYWAWSDHGEELWDAFDRDDILTTTMLYWLPGTILSAARIYYESSNSPPGTYMGGRVEVPTGYARFPAEPWAPPREVVERAFNLVHYSEPEEGGHFPALEQPRVWSGDVARFFSELG